MSIFSDSVLVQSLIPFLPPTSFAALYMASKAFYTHAKRLKINMYTVTRNRMQGALRHLFHDCRDPHMIADIILSACIAGHCFITGGFLLAVLNGDDLDKDFDLDLMVQHVPFEWHRDHGTAIQFPYKIIASLKYFDLLTPFYVGQDEDDGTVFKRFHQVCNDVNDGFLYKTSSVLSQVIDFCAGTRKIQLLAINKLENMQKHVNSYDFTFCSNFFGYKKLYINSLSHILYRECSVDLDKCYLLRTHVSDMNYLHHTYEPKVYNRFCKYIRRGYNICIVTRETNFEKLLPAMKFRLGNELVAFGDLHTDNLLMLSTALAQEWIAFWEERIRNGVICIDKFPLWKT